MSSRASRMTTSFFEATSTAGVAKLLGRELVYDILILSGTCRRRFEFVDRHPQQVFVVDHVAKPAIAKSEMEPWRANMRRLGERENVFCKVSGMATEAVGTAGLNADLRPYWDTVLESFGPGRLMFGSDWPVCLVATSYKRWLDTVAVWTAALTEDERDSVMGETAKKVYGLELGQEIEDESADLEATGRDSPGRCAGGGRKRRRSAAQGANDRPVRKRSEFVPRKESDGGFSAHTRARGSGDDCRRQRYQSGTGCGCECNSLALHAVREMPGVPARSAERMPV